MGRERGDVLAEKADGAARRIEVARDRVEQRGLASAVRSEDRAPFPGRDPHRDAGEGRQGAELPADVIQFQRIGAGSLQT